MSPALPCGQRTPLSFSSAVDRPRRSHATGRCRNLAACIGPARSAEVRTGCRAWRTEVRVVAQRAVPSKQGVMAPAAERRSGSCRTMPAAQPAKPTSLIPMSINSASAERLKTLLGPHRMAARARRRCGGRIKPARLSRWEVGGVGPTAPWRARDAIGAEGVWLADFLIRESYLGPAADEPCPSRRSIPPHYSHRGHPP